MPKSTGPGKKDSGFFLLTDECEKNVRNGKYGVGEV